MKRNFIAKVLALKIFHSKAIKSAKLYKRKPKRYKDVDIIGQIYESIK